MNMQNLMAQAQRMQKDITKKQEEIYKKTFVGKSEWKFPNALPLKGRLYFCSNASSSFGKSSHSIINESVS